MKQAEKPTAAEVIETEDYKKTFDNNRRAFRKAWEGYSEPVLRRNQSELNQIKSRMEAHMLKVFGGEYTIAFFLEQDISDRQARGFIPLTIGKFFNDERGKPTWSDSIAMGMKLTNAADGTIRWGSRGELLVCVIPTHIRAKNQQQDKENAAVLMNRHLGKGKQVKRKDDGSEIESQEVRYSKETGGSVKR